MKEAFRDREVTILVKMRKGIEKEKNQFHTPPYLQINAVGREQIRGGEGRGRRGRHCEGG